MTGDATRGLPRLLLLMGSGELTPTMAKVHRAVIERLGGTPCPCAFLDTPFAFQENASELAERAVTYFRERLRSPLEVARVEDGSAGADELASDRLAARLRRARYVFAGPGSPSYALEHWRDTAVPPLLVDKLQTGGALGFASAAALTLGTFTVPVYEIYKVGQPPRWLAGLDVLTPLGWRVAVLPHFDNAEGGTHDTRFCYLGERRLRVLEQALPEDAFILGIDEHTAFFCDLDAGRATVSGRGHVTLRRQGVSLVIENGETIGLDTIAQRALELGTPPPVRRTTLGSEDEATDASAERSLVMLEEELAAALGAREAGRAVAALLHLERAVETDGDGGLARAALRAALLGLEEPLAHGLADEAEIVGPYVELLLALRNRARDEQRYALADEIRDRLTGLGVEVRDTAAGSTWLLTSRNRKAAE